jgi:hypothetical protein
VKLLPVSSTSIHQWVIELPYRKVQYTFRNIELGWHENQLAFSCSWPADGSSGSCFL